MKIMNAQQAFNCAINSYPSLFMAPTLERAKIKYYEHIFNVIGNGYHDADDFIKEHTIKSKNKNLIESFNPKYIGATPLYMVYTKLKKYGNFEINDMSSALDGLYTSEDLKNMPHVVGKIQVNDKDRVHVPYPNFSKQYSMVWKMDMAQFDISWSEAAIEYYQWAKDFFQSDDCHLYHAAVPQNAQKREALIREFENHFQRYKTEGMSDTQYYDAVSQAYEHEYKGDTLAFIQSKWDKEHARIMVFIDETLTHLENIVESKNITAKKPKM